jgi:hypothetical protein
MKLIDASMAIVLMTMATACVDNSPKPEPQPDPPAIEDPVITVDPEKIPKQE